MNRQTQRRYLVAVILVGFMATAVELGNSLGIPRSYIIIFLIIAGLILGTVLLWQHANNRATGSEWWQDDSASGWRGY